MIEEQVMKLIYVPLSWLMVGSLAAHQLLTTGRIDQNKIADRTISIANKLKAFAEK